MFAYALETLEAPACHHTIHCYRWWGIPVSKKYKKKQKICFSPEGQFLQLQQTKSVKRSQREERRGQQQQTKEDKRKSVRRTETTTAADKRRQKKTKEERRGPQQKKASEVKRSQREERRGLQQKVGRFSCSWLLSTSLLYSMRQVHTVTILIFFS